jgi:hypothetical protein
MKHIAEAQEETKKYIIITSKDYADEFDYPVISIFSGKLRMLLLLHNEFFESIDVDEIYFGTNEFLSFNKKMIIDMINNAKEITTEELETLQKFKATSCGLDIIEHVYQNMLFRIKELGDPAYNQLIEELNNER